MILETKEELFFAMLFFGFFLFAASFPVADNEAFPPPNFSACIGVTPSPLRDTLLPEAAFPTELWSSVSADVLEAFSWFSLLADTVGLRYRCGGELRCLIATKESFVPATVGCGAVLRGLRLVMGASEG